MKVVVKGENYTEIRWIKGNRETIQHHHLAKDRKKEDCGVWQDGVKVCTWEKMLEVKNR